MANTGREPDDWNSEIRMLWPGVEFDLGHQELIQEVRPDGRYVWVHLQSGGRPLQLDGAVTAYREAKTVEALRLARKGARESLVRQVRER
jgi:hypothetical protein